jgi:hypothetical protein
MSDLAIKAEHLKLARLLGCPQEAVAGLQGLDVAALRRLRSACTSMLFDGDRGSLQRIVAVARLLPASVNALIAEKAMGPVLGSRVAGMLPPKDAVEIARRVPLHFNVEVTLLLDPRSAAPMLRVMPLDLVVAVTREMVKRREYIVMARFVDALTDEQIRACMAAMDDEAMLQSGFFVESVQRLEEVVELMSDERMRAVVGHAARPDLDLGGPVMALMSGVGPRLQRRMIEAALLHPDAHVGEHLVATARHHGLLGMLQAHAGALAPDAAQRLATLTA